MDPEPYLYIFAFQNSVPVAETSILVYAILFIILLIFSGLISSSEVAYFSLDIKEIKDLEEENSVASKRVLSLKEKPRYLLATILIANNFVNIAIVIVAEYILRMLLGQDTLLVIGYWIQERILFGMSSPEVIASAFNFLSTVVGVTFILVLFGEAMPKIYATLNKTKVIHLMSGPLTFLMIAFKPFSKILVGWSTSMEKSLSNTNNQGQSIREDIDAAIELTMNYDTPQSSKEVGILKGIVNFGDISAKQIMHSRTDIVALEESINFKEVMKIVRDSGYSRLPVYKDDLDNIVGILYVKDLLEYTDSNEQFKWQELLRTNVLFVPESKKIDELLREFQLKRMHMAIVVDEYGGTEGIATLEDIMEEVVGDIKDEFDHDEDVDYIKISENNYIFEGKTLLNDVCRIIGMSSGCFDDARGDSDSLAGLILEIVGTIPNSEKEITLGNITLKIVSVTKKRIEKISLLIHD